MFSDSRWRKRTLIRSIRNFFFVVIIPAPSKSDLRIYLACKYYFVIVVFAGLALSLPPSSHLVSRVALVTEPSMGEPVCQARLASWRAVSTSLLGVTLFYLHLP